MCISVVPSHEYFYAQAAHGAPAAAAFRKQVGTTGSLISFLDLGLLVGGVAVPITKPELTVPEFVSSPEMRFEINLRGNEGTAYRVDFSTNFTTWDLLTNVIGSTNGVSIVDTNVSGVGHRFYRAVQE